MTRTYKQWQSLATSTAPRRDTDFRYGRPKRRILFPMIWMREESVGGDRVGGRALINCALASEIC